MSVIAKIKDALTGPTDEEVREQYDPAEKPCPRCKSDEDYWRKNTRFAGTMYRCLNCGAEGMGP